MLQSFDISKITIPTDPARISEGMLHVAIGRFISIASPGSVFAGIDATGFEDRHAAPYCTYRCNIRHAFTKMSAGSDTESQLVCAVVIQHHHPVSHDIRHFPRLFSKMLDVTPMSTMVPDKGHDAEPVRRRIRDRNVYPLNDSSKGRKCSRFNRGQIQKTDEKGI